MCQFFYRHAMNTNHNPSINIFLILFINCLTTSTTCCTITSMTNSEKQRVTIFLNPDLIIQAKAQALLEEKSLATLIEHALVNYLPLETRIKRNYFLTGLI
jgi:hypothetical protein